jgi:cytochrome c-type biogenesis protein
VTALVGVGIAFTGGVLSFASPCCLPLVPAYLAFMVGTTDGAGRRRTLLHAVAFCIGFSLVFVAFWASIGLIGYLLADNVRYLRQAGGGLLVLLGLHVAGVISIPALWRELRPMPSLAGATAAVAVGGGGTAGVGASNANPAGYGRSLMFGSFFAAGWSPCIGPILGGIIGLASVSESVGQGTVLLAAYSAGLAVPFILAALGAVAVSQRLAWVGRHHLAVSRISGGFLVVVGILMVTNLLSRLAALPSPLGL